MVQQLLENVRCVCFDLDDTLWPLKDTISRAEKMAIEFVHTQEPACSDTFNPTNLSTARAKILQGDPDLRHRLTDFRYQVYRAVIALSVSHQESSKALARRAVETFLYHRNQVVPFAGVDRILQQLSSNFLLGAITNGNVSFSTIDISKYFSFYISAEQVGVSKPNAKIFARAYEECLRLDSKLRMPSEVLHVGDDNKTDVAGANNFGFLSAWLNPPSESHAKSTLAKEAGSGSTANQTVAPTVEIQSLAELSALLGR